MENVEFWGFEILRRNIYEESLACVKC